MTAFGPVGRLLGETVAAWREQGEERRLHMANMVWEAAHLVLAAATVFSVRQLGCNSFRAPVIAAATYSIPTAVTIVGYQALYCGVMEFRSAGAFRARGLALLAAGCCMLKIYEWVAWGSVGFRMVERCKPWPSMEEFISRIAERVEAGREMRRTTDLKEFDEGFFSTGAVGFRSVRKENPWANGFVTAPNKNAGDGSRHPHLP